MSKIVRKLAVHSVEFSQLIKTPEFQARAEVDAELQRQLELEIKIWEWVDGETLLKTRVKQVVKRLEREEMKVGRWGKLRRIMSAVGRFRSELEDVDEE